MLFLARFVSKRGQNPQETRSDPDVMPEGDTIFRAARTLNRALAGRTVVRFESMLPALTRVHEDSPITGRNVDEVRSAGKHVLMHFSGGLVLRTHMRMNGSWHIYRPGETWRRPRRDMRLVVATADFEAVGFNIPVAEFIRQRDLPRPPVVCGIASAVYVAQTYSQGAVAAGHSPGVASGATAIPRYLASILVFMPFRAGIHAIS